MKKHKEKYQALKLEQKELEFFIKEKGQNLHLNIKEKFNTLQNLIFELNKIPLVGINSKENPVILIYQLTEMIQNQINEIEVEDDINCDYLFEIIDIEKIKEIFEITSNIEKHIFKTLK